MSNEIQHENQWDHKYDKMISTINDCGGDDNNNNDNNLDPQSIQDVGDLISSVEQ